MRIPKRRNHYYLFYEDSATPRQYFVLQTLIKHYRWRVVRINVSDLWFWPWYLNDTVSVLPPYDSSFIKYKVHTFKCRPQDLDNKLVVLAPELFL